MYCEKYFGIKFFISIKLIYENFFRQRVDVENLRRSTYFVDNACISRNLF